MFGEQRQHAIVNPSALPKLDREHHVARQHRQKTGERRKLVRREVWAELNQNRTQLVIQLARAFEEFRRDLSDISQPPLVSDLLRHLQRECKAWRRAISPATYGLARRNRVEGGIHFDRIERARINREEVGRPGPDGIERPDPGLVIPSLCSDTDEGCFPPFADAVGHVGQSVAAVQVCQAGPELAHIDHMNDSGYKAMRERDDRDSTDGRIERAKEAALGPHSGKPSLGDEVGEATGGIAGVLLGAGICSSAGPVGTLLGGIAGAIGGWWSGRAIAEAAEKLSADDDAEFRAHYETSEQRLADRSYDEGRGAHF